MNSLLFLFFFNDPSTTEIYTLSLHDALPISKKKPPTPAISSGWEKTLCAPPSNGDRKSTRLNSSHVAISYAVFCLKKKKTKEYYSHELITNETHTSQGAVNNFLQLFCFRIEQ